MNPLRSNGLQLVLTEKRKSISVATVILFWCYSIISMLILYYLAICLRIFYDFVYNFGRIVLISYKYATFIAKHERQISVSYLEVLINDEAYTWRFRQGVKQSS